MASQTDFLRWDSQQIRLGDEQFVLRKTFQQSEDFKRLPLQSKSLLTVFVVEEDDIVDGKYLEQRVKHYLRQDDVFRKEFLANIVMVRSNEKTVNFGSFSSVLDRWGCQNLLQIKFSGATEDCPRGPYLWLDGILHQTWKIYYDTNHAFLAATWPSEDDLDNESFEVFASYRHAHGGIGIPVPSRLYTTKSAKRPLAGDRIAIKDNYHLKGVKTSLCSRDNLDFHSKQSSSAEAVRVLIELGAHIVGKTRLSSFAMWEEPAECVDFQAPFNPRGDSYQSPAGSSSGSGAAIASYDWIDFTLRTDMTGSGRRPALWNGSYALRPTQNTLSTQGIVHTLREFDVPSLFSRGIVDLARISAVWKGKLGTVVRQFPQENFSWEILYPEEYFPVANAGQDKAIKDFANLLASYVGCRLTRISLTSLWADSAPAEEREMDKYMANAQVQGFWFEAYHQLDAFRAEFEKRKGRPPYFTGANRWIWRIAEQLSESSYEEAMTRFKVFQRWFLHEVLQVDIKRTIMILPIETLSPRYRDLPSERKSEPPRSIDSLWLSPISGCPELVVPVGQVAYHSRITRQEEYLPVAASLLSGPGSELELMELVKDCFNQAKRPLEVQVGKEIGSGFPRY